MGIQLLVIDPLSRKLSIPRSAIRQTKALEREGTPSLCLLHMDGRCRQRNDCNQIHADATVVKRLRAAAVALPSCCTHHGDTNSPLFDQFPEWQGLMVVVGGVIMPLDRLAFTEGLRRSMNTTGTKIMNNCVTIQPEFICRLQAGGHCRYSEECKFVHLCREVTTEKLSHCVKPLCTNLEKKHKRQKTKLMAETNETSISTAEGDLDATLPFLGDANGANPIVPPPAFVFAQGNGSMGQKSMNMNDSTAAPSSEEMSNSTSSGPSHLTLDAPSGSVGGGVANQQQQAPLMMPTANPMTSPFFQVQNSTPGGLLPPQHLNQKAGPGSMPAATNSNSPDIPMLLPQSNLGMPMLNNSNSTPFMLSSGSQQAPLPFAAGMPAAAPWSPPFAPQIVPATQPHMPPQPMPSVQATGPKNGNFVVFVPQQ